MCFGGWRADLVDDDPDELERVVLHEFGHALGCIREHEVGRSTRLSAQEKAFIASIDPY